MFRNNKSNRGVIYMKHKVSSQLAKSIIDRSGGCCEICGSSNACQIHHILRRFVKPTYDNLVMLCWDHHLGTAGVHGKDGHQLDIKLKKNCKLNCLIVGFQRKKSGKIWVVNFIYLTRKYQWREFVSK